jgi:nitric oxide synthase oxygenase domain/subunit
MGAMEAKLDDLFALVREMKEDMATKDDLEQVKKEVEKTRDIVTAWQSVRWFGGMVQSMSKIIVAMGAIGAVIWAAIKLAVAGALK